MDKVLDARGIEFAEGQAVARASKLYKTDGICVIECSVTKVNNGKVYLDNAKVPLRFPERVMILSKA